MTDDIVVEQVDNDGVRSVEQLPDGSVEVSLGFTKSMGKETFEFLRVDFTYRASHIEQLDEMDELAEAAYEHAEAKVIDKVREMDEDLGPRGRNSQIHVNEDQ